MTHEECRDELPGLLYDDLLPRRASEVERHLAGCDGCRAERDRLASTLSVVRSLPSEDEAAPSRTWRGGDAPVAPIVLAAAREAAGKRKRQSFGAALSRFSVRVAIGTAFAVLFVVVVLTKGGLSPGDLARSPSTAPPSAPEPAAREGQPSAGIAAAPARPDPAGAGGAAKQTASQAPAAARSDASRAARAAARPEANAVLAEGSARKAEAEEAPRSAAPAADAAPAGPAASATTELERAAPARRASPRREAVGSDAEEAAGPPPVSAVATAVERRHAAGELSEAQRRFAPCPGGDLAREAWIDPAQRVLKLTRTRSEGVRVEEWFDDDGHLREARARGPDAQGGWERHVVVDDQGSERPVASSSGAAPGKGALAPDVPPPPFVRGDPAKAFFAGPGCEGAR